MTALDPDSVRLARASWDAATPASRTFLLLRSRYATRKAHNEALATGADFELFALSWADLPPETAEAIAWDVQFLRRVLGDGQRALRAATAAVEPVAGVAA